MAKQALAERRRSARSCSSTATSTGGKLTEEQLDAALDVLRMTHP